MVVILLSLVFMMILLKAAKGITMGPWNCITADMSVSAGTGKHETTRDSETHEDADGQRRQDEQTPCALEMGLDLSQFDPPAALVDFTGVDSEIIISIAQSAIERVARQIGRKAPSRASQSSESPEPAESCESHELLGGSPTEPAPESSAQAEIVEEPAGPARGDGSILPPNHKEALRRHGFGIRRILGQPGKNGVQNFSLSHLPAHVHKAAPLTITSPAVDSPSSVTILTQLIYKRVKWSSESILSTEAM